MKDNKEWPGYKRQNSAFLFGPQFGHQSQYVSLSPFKMYPDLFVLPPTTNIFLFLPSLSNGSCPAGKYKPPLPHSIQPSIPPSSFTICCVNHVTTTTGGFFMFSQEMKFDRTLKGRVSCVTPCPLKTPNESKLKMHCHEFEVTSVLVFFPSYNLSIQPVHLLGTGLLPLILSVWFWDLLHMDGQQGETPSGHRQLNHSTLWRMCENPPHIWVWSEGIWCIAWKHKRCCFVLFSCPFCLTAAFRQISALGNVCLRCWLVHSKSW